MLCNKLVVRKSKTSDAKAIRAIETQAFGRKAEANLVDQLIPAPEYTISLIALCDEEAIGHILLTEIFAPIKALALSPLAVVPKYREMQVGSQLVRKAIATAKIAGFEAIFVLGDILYYERFGFSGKLADPFKVEWQSKHFMALELTEDVLKGKSGTLAYPKPFMEL